MLRKEGCELPSRVRLREGPIGVIEGLHWVSLPCSWLSEDGAVTIQFPSEGTMLYGSLLRVLAGPSGCSECVWLVWGCLVLLLLLFWHCWGFLWGFGGCWSVGVFVGVGLGVWRVKSVVIQ